MAGAVFCRRLNGSLVLRCFAIERHGVDPAQRDAWHEQTGLSLASVAERLDARGRISLVIPEQLTLAKSIRIPAIAAGKRRAVIEFEAGQAIPFPLAEVAWDYRVADEDQVGLEVAVTAVKLEAIEKLCLAAHRAGLTVERVFSSGEAIAAGIRTDKAALAIRLEEDSATLALDDSGRSRSRAIVLPKAQVRVEPEASSGSGNGETQVDALRRETSRFLGNAPRETWRCSPTVVYLMGNQETRVDLAEALSKALNLPVEWLATLPRVDMSATARRGGALDQIETLVSLAGVARMDASGVRGGSGLLPAWVCRAAVIRRRKARWAAGLAAVVVALLSAIFYFDGTRRTASRNAAEIEARLRVLRPTIRENRENLSRLKQTCDRIEVMRGLLAEKTKWSAFFADLQETLTAVEDVWLDDLSVITPKKPATPGVAGKAKPPIMLRVSGRLLDPENPEAKVSALSSARAKRLLAGFEASPFVSAVRDQRFDNSAPGILRFDLTLVMEAEWM
ncbi:MAG: Competence protein [Verrucomicrobia bacterium]|nr:Competence protein [Verrucomicrobiota bacterium]